jgi:hypothetical protein
MEAYIVLLKGKKTKKKKKKERKKAEEAICRVPTKEKIT